jgi:hypothetical protein
MDTKCVVIFINGSILSDALHILKDKAVLFPRYTPGETGLESHGKAGVLSTASLENLSETMERHVAVIKTDEADLPRVAEAVGNAKDRRTLVVAVADDGVLFAGAGVTRERERSDRPVRAADILPTICYMTGCAVPGESTGALLYQAMKDPDSPFTRIAALESSVAALEYTIERSKRQAWDKHDCA